MRLRIPKLVLGLLRGMLFLLVFACTPRHAEPERSATAASISTDERIEAIEIEARRIDAAADKPNGARIRRRIKDLPHWHFSGDFEDSRPIFLDAIFTEGSVVRQESYYLLRGKPVLVKIEQWWDVDDERQEREPATRQVLYIDEDRTIRRVIEVASAPPVRRVDGTPRPAAGLAERSRLIAQILLGDVAGKPATDFLQRFPEVELPGP